jgi:hypothetical protein
LCDSSYLSFSPAVHNILQEDGNNTIECIEQFEQLQPLPKWEKNDCAAPTTSKESERSNTFSVAIAPCEYDHASLLSTIRLVHGHDNSILDDMHAEIRRVHCTASEKEDLNIIFSLNCLGYIEFDFLCDMKSLVKELFQKSGLLSFSRCSLRTIGKYDNGEYLVHNVYICSNLKAPFELQQHDQIMDYTNANDVLHSSSTFIFTQQVQPQEREQHLLWPCTIVIAPRADVKTSSLAAHWSKPRTACHQDRKDDGSIPSCLHTQGCHYNSMTTSPTLTAATTWQQQPRHSLHQRLHIQFGTMGPSYAHTHRLVFAIECPLGLLLSCQLESSVLRLILNYKPKSRKSLS